MDHDLTIAGADYPDVPSINVPITGGGTASYVAIGDTTAAASDVASGEVFYTSAGTRSIGTGLYAGAPVASGNANMTNAILYGAVDNTSTSTAFTATVSGLTALTDGTTVMLRNAVITSASGFTLEVNGLGALPVYNNMATGNPITPTNPTRDTTIFNINYTMLFTYVASDVVAGGCWLCYRGYNSDTNTIGYQLRTNSTAMKTAIRSRYYRIFFTSADGTQWEPANTGYDNSATSAKTVNTRPINPFGRIVYTSANTNFTAGSVVTATSIWDRYTLNLGYSFNRTGSALTLTYPAPVYVKCAPQTNGSAIIDSTTPIVQSLPSTNDGKIYIYLGMAYSATNIELVDWHPVYCHDGTGIRVWTGASAGGSSVAWGDVTGKPFTSVTGSADVAPMSYLITSGGYCYYEGMEIAQPLSDLSFLKAGQTLSVSIGTATDVEMTCAEANMSIGQGGTCARLTGTGTIYELKFIDMGSDSYRCTARTTSRVDSDSDVTGTITLVPYDVIDTSALPTATASTPGIVALEFTTASLGTSGWSSNTRTINVAGVTTSNNVIVVPAPSSAASYAAAGIVCTAQGAGTLTFTRTSANSSALKINVLILG